MQNQPNLQRTHPRGDVHTFMETLADIITPPFAELIITARRTEPPCHERHPTHHSTDSETGLSREASNTPGSPSS